MSLSGALSVGLTGLSVSQTQIQTTGNNIANANTPGYSREVAGQAPLPTQQIQPGMFIGTGVTLTGIQAQIDAALDSRLRGATSDNQSAQTTQQWLGQVESTLGALNGNDVGTKLTTFFNSWSSLANTPQDAGLRQNVLQGGDSLAKTFQDTRSQLASLQGSAGDQFKTLTSQANDLAQQVAELNSQIVVAQGATGGSANSLVDQRGAILTKLAALTNITTINQPNGAVNVYIGSEPLVIANVNRGLIAKQQTSNGATSQGLQSYSLAFKADNSDVSTTGGQLGALAAAEGKINAAVDNIDTLAKNLIFEVNKIHASGQGLDGISSVTSTNTVTNPAVPLNDPKSGLKFAPNNGSFVVHVKQKSTGLETSTLVQVDLTGSANDTTLNSLKASLAGINGVNASVVGGKLTLTAANADTQLSFSQDTSGTLAALGVNSFYTGSSALNIAVNQTLTAQPTLLAAAKNGEPADNQTALAMAALNSQSLTSLKGASLNGSFQAIVNGVASDTAAAKSNAEASQGIADTLQAQRDALSGVSLDEEAVNLMKQQRAYQASARLISTVDDLMKTLLAIN